MQEQTIRVRFDSEQMAQGPSANKMFALKSRREQSGMPQRDSS